MPCQLLFLVHIARHARVAATCLGARNPLLNREKLWFNGCSGHSGASPGTPEDRELFLAGIVRKYACSAQTVLAGILWIDAQKDERIGTDCRSDELPEELQRRKSRLAKSRQAKEALEREARETETARRAGLEMRRRPPIGRHPFKPKPAAQRNFTDPQSRIMKTSHGTCTSATTARRSWTSPRR